MRNHAARFLTSAPTWQLTGGGIHAKWLPAQVDGVTWSAVGSLNGGEISYKVNREVVLMVDDPVVYERLLAVFRHDWALGAAQKSHWVDQQLTSTD
ncbi:MAG: hypothetical protein IT328_00080 [Caldilineaceae bacterium]|nr:hypothetical protein [Caldilineaceae bacterium]